MTEKKKTFRHTECGFNPLERMTVAANDSGQILVDTLKSRNGSFLLSREDASVVYVPKLKLTLNDYKDWWNSACPDGRMERSTEIHTIRATTWIQNGDAKTPVEYPYNEKTIEIKFFEHADDAYPKAVGAGTVPYTYGDETADGLAEYMAWKSAMTSMGFGTDITAQDLYLALPMYCEKIEVESGVLSGSGEEILLRRIPSGAVLIEPKMMESQSPEMDVSKEATREKKQRKKEKKEEEKADAARQREAAECLPENVLSETAPFKESGDTLREEEAFSSETASPEAPLKQKETSSEEEILPETMHLEHAQDKIPASRETLQVIKEAGAEKTKPEALFPEDGTEDFAELLKFTEDSGWTIEKARAQQITYVKEGGVKKIITRFVSGNTLGDVYDFTQGGINKGKELLKLMLRPSNRVYFDENTIRAAEFLAEAL